MFTLRHVAKHFGDGMKALEDITAEIPPGSFVALLGPSGCGKSTLLRLLSGLEMPSSGEISWGHTGKPAPGEIGYVFQDPTLLPWANAAENVYLPLRLRRESWSSAMPRVHTALAQVGLEGFEQSKPKGLSGGMRMRVSIARALVSEPALLLMDEPFAALDEFTRHKLQDDLLALWRRTGKTVVFVTHSIYEAAYLANRILIMTPRPGRIAATLTPNLPVGVERRNSPAYHALVSEITASFQRIMPA
ncbi:ABC transporter ATP-binding protein [Acidocella aminolytica]|jgi:NitT/TauT family transport system ATP-binding protein|uniref:ABC transporter n=1 Tax=Acidocella aminolytica 101 = DSM 11237 TaxID=1120923 RepID=A0A0D6PG46_9PROT|nr:ABC transporter ATP-binding protein [Acidocella aminolytica]GAN80178.1 ABC transporter [Acidocella aminolytica 101 = DSM 11237]GBQ37357.1 nitrate/sulfonate/bicarbonate transporter ATP-binding protein [Acidocella aminolytica 101 = DSM 11237]SHF29170.1 NitT/TauT family transport system ATP-binding protein [Acidocella aminolytica 101 = DSM 11237]